jgi:ABC-2 type transport system permease protein
MAERYSQTKAMLAIAKASFRAIFKSPQATFFSLFFPVVLIVIFSAIGGGGGVSFDVAFDKNSDSTNELYYRLKQTGYLHIQKANDQELQDRMKKGRIAAIIDIKKADSVNGKQGYEIHLTSTQASQRELPQLQRFIQGVVDGMDREKRQMPSSADIKSNIVEGRRYRMIDFYLPSMIGFSLIGSAVFGVAFVFFNLRQTLVLKRMYASPITKSNIVIGESLGRVLFQLITVIFLILFGTYVYHFTLSNGVLTFLEMLVLSTIGLLLFMGFGFFISSVAKNQNVIPIYANLFMFPQYFLSGTFFPKNFMPQSVQWLINILPLTALNDSLRKISFEGSHLNDCWKELAILGIWGVIIYGIAIKFFKWE